MPRPSLPPSAPAATVYVANRQRRVPVPLPWLRTFATAALPACLTAAGGLPAEIEEYEVTVVSDKTIAQVHWDFMQLPDPTDVITFHHGEIVVSAETAQTRAQELGHSTAAEIGLYIIHGLLHLNGFDDTTPAARKRMHQVQDRIWRATLRAVPPPP